MDEATVEILLKAKEDGLEHIRRMADALEDLRRQAEQTNAMLEFIGAASMVTSMGINELNDSLNKTTPATQGSTQAAAQSTSVWATLGTTLGTVGAAIVPVLVVLGLLAVLAGGPLLVALAGAVVMTTAFALGIAAVAAELVLALGPLAALGAAVVLLSEHLFSAGKILTDPLLGLENNLQKMVNTWGQQALPMARQIIDWLDSLVPKVSATGKELLTWFGDRLPTVLHIMSGAFDTMLKTVDKLGTVFGNFIDTLTGMGRVTTSIPALQQMFNLMLNAGVEAVTGLLSNLVRLSDWFIQRMPQLGPIVGQIFGQMGTAIQGVADAAGQLVDWFIAHWPEISKQAAQVWSVLGPTLANIVLAAGNAVAWFTENWPKIRDVVVWVFQQIKAGWDSLAPVFNWLIPQAINLTTFTLDYLKQHTELVTAVVYGLQLILIVIGGVLAATALLVIGMGAAFAGIVLIVGDVARAIGNLADKLSNAQGLAWGLVGALAAITHSPPPNIGNITGQAPFGGGGGGGNFTAQSGGRVPGLPGAPVITQLHAGEVVLSPNQLATMVALLQQIANNTTSNYGFNNTAYGRA